MKTFFTKKPFYSLIGLLGLLSAFIITPVIASSDLNEIIEDLKKDPDIQHINNADLEKIPSDDVVIFDVRKDIEYKVSHIPYAIHLNPRTSANDFLKQHGDKLEGKVAVFYCSVGQRSTGMLSRLSEEDLKKAGVTQAYNLEGGAFKRHNDGFGFVKNGKSTKNIHPYNAYYGRLVDNKEAIKYK